MFLKQVSMNEIRSLNHYMSRLKDIEHFDWFFWLNMRNSRLCKIYHFV